MSSATVDRIGYVLLAAYVVVSLCVLLTSALNAKPYECPKPFANGMKLWSCTQDCHR